MNSSPNDAENPATSWVLDASALIALLLGERGDDRVREVLKNPCAMSMVNVGEVVARLTRAGYTEDDIRRSFAGFKVELFDFDYDQSWLSGRMIDLTRPFGLSLGDRACLALARKLDLPVLTADYDWVYLDVGVQVHLCRTREVRRRP